MPNKKNVHKTTQTKSLSPSLIAACAAIVIAVVMIVVAAVSMAGGKDNTSSAADVSSVDTTVSYHETSYETKEEYTYVQIEMEDGGKIVLELYPETAPITVANFVKLVKDGFYDGLIFHRVIEGFMIQGGDPEGTGLGGSPDTIYGEFSANGFDNPLKHERGVISMARKSTPMDSASSQFFIVHSTSPHLDGQYAAFGRVVSGMGVVDAIAAVDTNSNDKPYEDVKMKKVTVLHEAPVSEETSSEE